MMADHGALRLTPSPGGGFVLRFGSGEPIRGVPEEDGWRIEGGGMNGWRLVRGKDEEVGFRLLSPNGPPESAALTARFPDAETGCGTLLLEDGRLFRMVLRGAREVRYELLGWEAPGAYLVASRDDAGWRIEPRPACGALADIRSLCLLLAAEVLDSGERLVAGRSDEAAT